MKNASYFVRRLLLCICIVQIASFTYAQQIAKSLTAANGTFIGFYEYKPVDYNDDPSIKYPLIIFLHGIGERGNGTTELSKVKANAIPKYISRGHKMRFYWNGKWETFLVLSPQLSSKYGSWQPFYVEEMINYARKNLRIDTNRIILTGLSLGGGGVWSYASAAAANSKKLACIAPVCGTCSLGNASYLTNANLPVWAFHAINDPRVSVNCTNNAIIKIQNYKPLVEPIKTLYNDGGHVIWDRAFDTVYKWQEPNIYEWFLGQNKSLPPNILPVAKAGTDISISSISGTAILNGNGSTDADGKIVKYIWKPISGPAKAILASSRNVSTSISGLTTDGTYTFELTVIDNRTGWKKDTVTITASSLVPSPNKAPVSRAGTDINISLPVNSITLDGSASSDPDGSISSFQWTKISGPSSYTFSDAGAENTGVSNLAEGTYVFVLEVKDNDGGSDKDSVKVIVNPAPNQPPTAAAGSDITVALPLDSASLDGTASKDADGKIDFYEWAKINGPGGYIIRDKNNPVTTISNLTEGTYQFQLEVKDNKGTSDLDTIIIKVKPEVKAPNLGPSANAGKDITITLPASGTTLNGSASSDPDGVISSYNWTFIGGPSSPAIATSSKSNTVVSNLIEGTYTFQLKVLDDDGAANMDTVKVLVKSAPNKSPMAKAGTDIIITLPVNSTTLNGSASVDPDGTIRSFAWSGISGPAGYIFANPKAAKTGLEHLVEGKYALELKVTDDKGLSSTDRVIVTVMPKPNKAPVANAGSDITAAMPVDLVSLNGSSSYDPDGSLLAYSWTKLSGAGGLTIVNATTVKPTVMGLKAGKYVFRLTVVDNLGAKTTDDVIVTILSEPNKAPQADAGKDTIVGYPGQGAILNGSASVDPDGTVSGYWWHQLSGPTAAILPKASTPICETGNLEPGEYLFELRVQDNEGATAKDSVHLTVVNNFRYEEKISIFPNPASAIIHINCTSDSMGKIRMIVYDASGHYISTINDEKRSLSFVRDIHVSTWNPGMYFIEIIIADKKRMIGRFLKQ